MKEFTKSQQKHILQETEKIVTDTRKEAQKELLDELISHFHEDYEVDIENLHELISVKLEKLSKK